MPSSSTVLVDVWVNGPANPSLAISNQRAELLRRIADLQLVAGDEGAAFLAGARLRVCRGVGAEEAERAVAALRALGARVELERGSADEPLTLDQLRPPEPDTVGPPTLDTSVALALVALDGELAAEVDPAPASAAPGGAAGRGTPAAPLAIDDERRFRPAGDFAAPMDLQLERPVAVVTATPPANGNVGSTHDDDPADGGREWSSSSTAFVPIPGRIAHGALRQNAAARIGLGVALGLGLGWLLSLPYGHRAERHVAELRAEADLERYRPVEEAQARVRALDAAVDDAASQAALGTALIWVTIAAAAFAGWWRAT